MQEIIKTFKNRLEDCDILGDVYIKLDNYKNRAGELTIDIDGWCEEEETFSVTLPDIKAFFKWLEQILYRPLETHQFTFKDSHREHHDFVLGYCSYACYKDELEDFKDLLIEGVNISECGLWYLQDVVSNQVTLSTIGRTEDLVARIYTSIKRNDRLRTASEGIKAYFMATESKTFAYAGYTTTAKFEDWDFRFWGDIISVGSEGERNRGSIAANNLQEYEERFKEVVDDLIYSDKRKAKNEEWQRSGVDVDSIIAVFHMHPDELRKRILNKQYDISLNTKVPRGDYEVPLYYVTKAWDYILKGDTGRFSFWLEPDPDDDEAPAIRTLQTAIEDNEKIKEIWKEYFSVDIDELDVDFDKFDLHIANVSDSYYAWYFTSVPNGLEEWILDGVCRPHDGCNFDHVSCLMEFAAYVRIQRRSSDSTWK